MSIQLKRGLSTARKNSEVILEDGQPFFEKDTKQLYIGDGETKLKDLQASGSSNIHNSEGLYALQQTSDPGKKGYLKFPEADLYAKILDPTLTLDKEPIGGQADYSTSFGGNSSAQAKRSFAAGTTTVAKGAYSAVFGDNSVTLKSATDSMAQGYQTVVNAPTSHSEGAYTVVMNKKYVEGMFDPSSSGSGSGSSSGSGSGEPGSTPTDTLQMDNRRGEAGHADGFNSYVSGFAAHTDGVSNVADGHISKASGRSNRAWSYLSKVDGYQSVVKPDETDTDATGEGSWANGKDIQIVGAKYSYGGGYQGRVSKGANYSFSYGLGLVAQAEAQSVVGQYNVGDDISAFVVGTGISSSDRKTALRVLKSGQVLIKDVPANPEAPIRLKDFTDDFFASSKAELAKRAIQANDFAEDGTIKTNLDSHLQQIQSNSSQISSLVTTIKETNSNLSGVANSVHSLKLWQAGITSEYRIETLDQSQFFIYYDNTGTPLLSCDKSLITTYKPSKIQTDSSAIAPTTIYTWDDISGSKVNGCKITNISARVQSHVSSGRHQIEQFTYTVYKDNLIDFMYGSTDSWKVYNGENYTHGSGYTNDSLTVTVSNIQSPKNEKIATVNKRLFLQYTVTVTAYDIKRYVDYLPSRNITAIGNVNNLYNLLV